MESERGKARLLFRHIPDPRRRAQRVSDHVQDRVREVRGRNSTLSPLHRKKGDRIFRDNVRPISLLLTVFVESESLPN